MSHVVQALGSVDTSEAGSFQRCGDDAAAGDEWLPTGRLLTVGFSLHIFGLLHAISHRHVGNTEGHGMFVSSAARSMGS